MTTRFNPFRREAQPREAPAFYADPIPETTAANVPQAPQAVPDITRLFIAAYGQPPSTLNPQPSTISLPYGHMAVTLCAKFNDSAPQVDHFNYHAGLGCPDFALLIIPKQSKTERLARQALSLCPDLAVGAVGPCGSPLEWTWKSETWSMGHGNYLLSSSFELAPELRAVRHTFGSKLVTRAFWEIEFTTNLREGQLVELWPHKNFRSSIPQPRGAEGALRGRPTASVILNHERQGVEIHFSRRPDDAALQPLRDDRRWRYTGYARCWYARQSPEAIAWAQAFVNHFNGDTTPTTNAAPLPPRLSVIAPATADVVSPALSCELVASVL